jgi:peptidoglycan/LPS O-acetylase OafA/YrhL
MAQPGSSERFVFLDGLRGLSAALVMLYHFYTRAPFYDSLRNFWPRPFHSIFHNGWIGVQIFFVISGFVIAHSVGQSRVTLGYCANFVLRRQIRLDPCYWATILAAIAIAAYDVFVRHDPEASLPSLGDLLAHVLYVYKLFEYPGIVDVFWSLCHEVQFYLFFISLVALAQWSGPFVSLGIKAESASTIFLIVAVTGLLSAQFAWSNAIRHEGLAAETWWLFSLGVAAQQFHARRQPIWRVAAFFAFMTLYVAYYGRLARVSALASAYLIVVASAAGGLPRWLRLSPIQYLGRISYSLYLIHQLVGLRFVQWAGAWQPSSPAWGLLCLVIGVGLTLLAADAMHRCVERPSIYWAKRLKASD